jgi:hypothetical protein
VQRAAQAMSSSALDETGCLGATTVQPYLPNGTPAPPPPPPNGFLPVGSAAAGPVRLPQPTPAAPHVGNGAVGENGALRTRRRGRPRKDAAAPPRAPQQGPDLQGEGAQPPPELQSADVAALAAAAATVSAGHTEQTLSNSRIMLQLVQNISRPSASVNRVRTEGLEEGVTSVWQGQPADVTAEEPASTLRYRAVFSTTMPNPL